MTEVISSYKFKEEAYILHCNYILVDNGYHIIYFVQYNLLPDNYFLCCYMCNDSNTCLEDLDKISTQY